MNNRLITYLGDYQAIHQKTSTRITHYIGIPLIVLSLFILFNCIEISLTGYISLKLSWLMVIIALVLYLFFDFYLAIIMTLVMFVFSLVGYWIVMPYPTFNTLLLILFAFALGWGLQFLGHFFEEKKPAFFDNLTHLLIGPLFIVVELHFFLGKLLPLQEKIDHYVTYSHH